ncbi:class C sortase [Dysosmobacter sp.]|uniref:class C sortase n=1 Tax=Dysosmobacter sp. TaxID=2591382 RepID=UPI002A900CEA|nr:class C sortase [Dysosmobacter sp.]MDY3984020.1 class C sortase [Dysosmobacter sp.]
MKKHLSTVILILVFLTGLSLLLYPSVSDYWNSFHQSRAIATYAGEVAALDNDDYDQLWASAQAYNQRLAEKEKPLIQSEEDLAEYETLLDIAGSGVMGYIEIPEIKVSLPIYHGVDEGVLQIAVGHIPGTSLPTGGKGTHSVLSGHRGLPSAKLFTNLDQLREGDTFLLRVLDETLTYEVDQILIVEPHQLEALAIDPGQDYCTLVTCTPYGVNTHRLLVRGHRVENQADAASIRVTADAMQIEPVIVAPVVAAPMLLFLMLWVLLRNPKKKKR